MLKILIFIYRIELLLMCDTTVIFLFSSFRFYAIVCPLATGKAYRNTKILLVTAWILAVVSASPQVSRDSVTSCTTVVAVGGINDAGFVTPIALNVGAPHREDRGDLCHSHYAQAYRTVMHKEEG
jgi:hypothetical protein